MDSITIGGLRHSAMAAKESDNALTELEYVKTMALIQIAQDMNEIKHILEEQNQ